jgi:hypothetical protein
VQFTLYYRGRLKSNAGPADKHALRQHFHRQLKRLWTQPPLADYVRMLLPERLNDLGLPEELSIIKKLHGFEFAPLVCEKVALVAELQIQMLWPQAPGAIVSAGGDIDNRLKTLFDSLKMPSETTALPKGTSPSQDEKPFYCLLEDDRLITRVDVETDRLLEPDLDPAEVALFIRVRTRQLRVMWGTVGLG